MANKKLLATDFDGTFLIKGKIPPECGPEIARFRERGGLFGFVTGRGKDFAETVKGYGADYYDYLILYNGALITRADGTKVFESFIERDVFKKLEDCHRRLGDAEYYDKADEKELYPQYYSTFADEKRALEAAAEINRLFGDKITAYVNGPHVNIAALGTGKAQGVALAAEHFGVAREDVYVIGDDHNDVGMIEAFDGYAVENARDAVKNVAKKLFPSVGALAGYICDNE